MANIKGLYLMVKTPFEFVFFHLKVVPGLHIQPEPFRLSEILGEPQGSIRTYGTFSMNNLIVILNLKPKNYKFSRMRRRSSTAAIVSWDRDTVPKRLESLSLEMERISSHLIKLRF